MATATRKAPTKVSPKTASKRPTSRKPVKVTPATKTAKATPKVKTPAPPSVHAPRNELDPHGFVPGSDSSIIAAALVTGGESRTDINANILSAITETNGGTTRYGTDKNIPSLVAGILRRLKDKGYTIEQTWRLVPTPAVQEVLEEYEAQQKKEAAAAKRRATRAANAKK